MRIYDPRVWRFLSVDPLTEKYPELTPYQFASNTPLKDIDLDGMEGFDLSSSPLYRAQMSEAKFNLPNARDVKSKMVVQYDLIRLNSAPSGTPARQDAVRTIHTRTIGSDHVVTQQEALFANLSKTPTSGDIRAPQPQPSFDNDFERGMVTNPLIQTSAIAMASPFVANATMATGQWLFKPQTLGLGSLAAGSSDVLFQGFATKWDLTKYNPASTFGSMVFRNPIGGAIFGDFFEVNYAKGITFPTKGLFDHTKAITTGATGTMAGNAIGSEMTPVYGHYLGNFLGSNVGNAGAAAAQNYQNTTPNINNNSDGTQTIHTNPVNH